MEGPELLSALIELAGEAGLRVRAAGPAGEGPLESGVCRVRGELWLVLSASDPVAHRIDVVARALRAHAAPFLESRWLPPALRARIEEAG
jgi:hypothetical protein